MTTSNPVPVDDGDRVLFMASHVAILFELASYDRGLKLLAVAKAMSDMAWRNARVPMLGCIPGIRQAASARMDPDDQMRFGKCLVILIF